MSAITQPIINIIVVGFHHKKGCQIEYAYPELTPGSPHELPSAWRHLPALALPDGSHNFHSDTVYFHLPGLTQPPHTVFAVSCFRQIPLEQVTQRTSDMTRSSVQKSVCVISREPLFGRLAIKLELVARAWFRRGDFCSTQLLEDTYKHLNGCPAVTDQVLEGLSVANLVETWRHKAVLLFKLLLLQRKVVLHGSPAGPVSSSLLTLLSLHPDCIQKGLYKSANIILSRPMSPTPSAPLVHNDPQTDQQSSEKHSAPNKNDTTQNGSLLEIEQIFFGKEETCIEGDNCNNFVIDKDQVEDRLNGDESNVIGEREKCHSVGEKYKSPKTLPESHSSPSMVREMSVNGLAHLAGDAEFCEFGLPLKLFSEGYLCLPYLSLQYMDLLSDPAVKGFMIGASNVLFKQKRQLFDVLVETNDLRIETADFSLRRQLQLSTEDLRFADHLVRHASLQGDAWIRDQFAGYLLCLLRTSLLPDGSREIDNFNASFLSAFKATEAYQDWISSGNRGVDDLFTNMPAGHPFAGQLSVTDMKLRLAHTMSSTESGRKVTQAVVSTGRAVASTSRVVGGALSQAKGAFSVWWNTLTTPSPVGENPPATDPDFEVLEALPQEDKTVDDARSHVEALTVSNDCRKQVAEKPECITIHCASDVERNSDAEEAVENMETDNKTKTNVANISLSGTVSSAAHK